MRDKSIRFGTGGWRAIIGEEFIRDNIEKVAQAFSNVMIREGKADKPVVLGYDRRFMSDVAVRWMARVFAANGIHTWFMKRTAPTPLVMYIVKEKKLHYGIEVTASHNPPIYNGIKLIVEEGRDAPVECTKIMEDEIEAVTEVKSMTFDEAVEKGFIEFMKNPFNEYIDFILSKIDTEAIKESGIRVLFDPMHGSGIYPFMVIMYTSRCTIDLMNDNKDAYFGGHNPAPNKNILESLADRVVDGHYDLGLAMDGDGDRLGVIDPTGEYIDANKAIVMLYYYLHEYKGWKGPAVRNLATTHTLDRVAESFGEKCYEVPIGFKYISSKLDETDAVIGGESSGGLTVRGHIFGKDSVYALSLFVEMISKIGKSPLEFWKDIEEKYGHTEFVEGNYSFESDRKQEIYDKIMINKELPAFNREVEKVGYEDGCKVYFKDGSFVICRFSGTEPLLRIYAEDKTKEFAEENIKAFANLCGI